MKMLWVVSEYADQIKQKTESVALSKWCGHHENWPHRFETEAEAREFVIGRARAELAKARLEVKRKEQRLKKVTKKYGGG